MYPQKFVEFEFDLRRNDGYNDYYDGDWNSVLERNFRQITCKYDETDMTTHLELKNYTLVFSNVDISVYKISGTDGRRWAFSVLNHRSNVPSLTVFQNYTFINVPIHSSEEQYFQHSTVYDFGEFQYKDISKISDFISTVNAFVGDKIKGIIYGTKS